MGSHLCYLSLIPAMVAQPLCSLHPRGHVSQRKGNICYGYFSINSLTDAQTKLLFHDPMIHFWKVLFVCCLFVLAWKPLSQPLYPSQSVHYIFQLPLTSLPLAVSTWFMELNSIPSLTNRDRHPSSDSISWFPFPLLFAHGKTLLVLQKSVWETLMPTDYEVWAAVDGTEIGYHNDSEIGCQVKM